MPGTYPRSREDFHFAIICVLPVERDAVEALLSRNFEEEGGGWGRASDDRNSYTTGMLGGKAVVIPALRGAGSHDAGIVVGDITKTFRNVRIAFLVGVAGGAPQTPDGRDIMLGDVLIGKALIQYDFGRQYEHTFRRKTDVLHALGRTTPELAHFEASLESYQVTRRLIIKTSRNAATVMDKLGYRQPIAQYPFPSNFRHKHRDGTCVTCSNCRAWYDPVCEAALLATCGELNCEAILCTSPDGAGERALQISRSPNSRSIQVFFGLMASGNAVIKSGYHRDQLVQHENVIGFEMEGTGMWDQMPTMVIKAVCDFADSHKNKDWQGAAAARAAACTEAILEEWQMSDSRDVGAADARRPALREWIPPVRPPISSGVALERSSTDTARTLVQVEEPAHQAELLWHALGFGRDWIKQDTKKYWSLLTLTSYKHYERIYESCQPHRGPGSVLRFEQLRQQVPRSLISDAQLEDVWNRLAWRRNGSKLDAVPKSFGLAMLFMLHVEQSDIKFSRLQENGAGGISAERRERLKRWTKWVPCQCLPNFRCPARWNFANDDGLVERASNICEVDHWMKTWPRINVGKMYRAHEDLKSAWRAPIPSH